MRDTMYQEALLTYVDEIDSVRLYAEYEVLTAMGESYIKSAMMIQEAEGADVEEAPKDTSQKKKWYQTVWEWIKTTAGKIAKFFRELPGKIKKFFKELPGKIKGAGKSITLKTGEIVGMIKDGGQLRYIGEADYPGDQADPVGDLLNPHNYEITIKLDPDVAMTILNEINNAELTEGDPTGKKMGALLIAINNNKKFFNTAFTKKTMNLEEFLQKTEGMAQLCTALQKTCDKYKKAAFESENEKVEKFMNKEFKDVAASLNQFTAFLMKLAAQSAIPNQLLSNFVEKILVKPVSKGIAKQIKKTKDTSGEAAGEPAPAGA